MVTPTKHVLEMRGGDVPGFAESDGRRLQQELDAFATTSRAEYLRDTPQLALFGTAKGDDVAIGCEEGDMVIA